MKGRYDMKRLLIVVNYEGYPMLWNKTEGPPWKTVESYGRCCSIDDDCLVILRHPGATTIEEQREKTKPLLSQVLQQPQSLACEKVFVWTHRGRVDWRNLRQQLAGKYGNGWDFNNDAGIDPVFDALETLFSERTRENVAKLLAESERRSSLAHVTQVRVLRHDLAALFLPLDIELQSWQERHFSTDCWERLSQTYGEKNVANLLSQAKVILYGVGPASICVQNAVRQVEGLQDHSISTLWASIQRALPRSAPDFRNANIRDLFRAGGIYAIFGVLNKGSPEDWRKLFTGGKDHAVRVCSKRLLDLLAQLADRMEHCATSPADNH
jgi:hypothetical protein